MFKLSNTARVFLFCGILMLNACQSSEYMAPVVNRSQSIGPRPNSYIVCRGDTLYSIAFSFGMDFRTLAAINHIAPPYAIHPGQPLYLNRPLNYPASQSSTHPSKFVLPTSANDGSTNYRGKLSWVWPARGKILKAFGKNNKGIDIAGQFKEPIYASAKGVIVYAGHGIREYGNLLIINHNDIYLTAYAHNDQLLVRQGVHVQKGQQIATMGVDMNRQSVMHFEIRQNGRPVNPLNYLPR